MALRQECNYDYKKQKENEIISHSRRGVLKASLASLAYFSVAGLTVIPNRSQAATLNYNFVAETYNDTMVDGVVLEAWRFRDLAGNSGPGALEAGIVALEGDTVNINLTNNLNHTINFTIPGFINSPASIAAGASTTINFTAPAAGTYLFKDDYSSGVSTEEKEAALGLSGPMIVMPSNGAQQLYPGATTFDRQYILVLTDFDDRLNNATASAQVYDMVQFEPNYFFANGLSYPNTSSDPETKVLMSLNEEVAIRFVNAGLLAHSMHFHGYHVRVISHDRILETQVIDKDTVLVRPGECVDVMLTVNQTGIFPLHTHYIPAVTANGVYVNPVGGALLILDAS